MSEKSAAPAAEESHRQSPVAEYFKEVVYGGVDGTVTTFAIVSGFSGAALSSNTTAELSFAIVLLFGLANLFADAVSMGLGNFLSVRSEQDQYRIMRRREQALIRADPAAERAETVAIMMEKGFTKADAATLAALYEKNEDYWLDFMMGSEYRMSDPRGHNPFLTGFTTFAAFLCFGAIPILPFLFLADESSSAIFQISSAGTLLALILLGFLKWRIVGTDLARSVAEIVVVGSAAAVIAFLVGTFFQI